MVAGASDEFHALVEEDLNRERASALGRAGRRLSKALTACAGARQEFLLARRADDRRRVAEARRAYVEAYAGYEQVRTDFCIQREANRLFDHRLISHFYPPPCPPALLGTDASARADR